MSDLTLAPEKLCSEELQISPDKRGCGELTTYQAAREGVRP